MINKKNFEVLKKVFGTNKLEGVMPFAYIDNMGISLRSYDALHTIFLSAETAGSEAKQVSYTMLSAALSQVNSFDEVTIGTDGTVSLYDSVAQEDYVVPVAISNGTYVNLLAKMQGVAAEEEYELNKREFYLESKAQLEDIFLFIQESEAYVSAIDFANLQKMAHLLIDEDVTVVVVPSKNAFVIMNKFVTYMTDHSVYDNKPQGDNNADN